MVLLNDNDVEEEDFIKKTKKRERERKKERRRVLSATMPCESLHVPFRHNLG